MSDSKKEIARRVLREIEDNPEAREIDIITKYPISSGTFYRWKQIILMERDRSAPEPEGDPEGPGDRGGNSGLQMESVIPDYTPELPPAKKEDHDEDEDEDGDTDEFEVIL